MKYAEFLKQKVIIDCNSGFDLPIESISKLLFPFQSAIVKWALKRGRAAIFADTGLGKGQPHGSKIMTVSGWKKIENLTKNDKVISSDGRGYYVKAIYRKKEIDTYRFYFSDKSSFVVDKDHLHIVKTNNDRARCKPWKIMSTLDLVDSGNIRYSGQGRNYNIPVVKPIKFKKKYKGQISPYVLGVLLGDGSLSGQVCVSSSDIEIINKVKKELPIGVSLEKKNNSKYDWKIRSGLFGTKKSPFIQELNELGLLNKKSHTKYIPLCYLYNKNINDRLDLLKGLMDTDGYIAKCGTCQFYSVSKKLAERVLFLVRSLGGIPTFSKKKSFIKNKRYKDCFIVTFSLKTYNPFYLKRKSDRWNPNPRDNGRWIDRIEYEKKQKTMQLKWAEEVHKKINKPILIFAPLAVSKQTRREGDKFDVTVNICESQTDMINGINITNYEKLHKFSNKDLGAIVIDESSILKGFDGKFRKRITEFAEIIPYRLACTATPAPNDIMEIINHAEFLGIMKQKEITGLFFIQDGNVTHKWRLKHHAVDDFYKWLASWAVALKKPSDLGFSDKGYDLPPLKYHHITVNSSFSKGNQLSLFPVQATSLRESQIARKESTPDRIAKCIDVVNNGNGNQWLIWCDLNKESNNISKLLPDAVEIKGADTVYHKENSMVEFQKGKIKILVSKSSICGFGMNWQNCHNMVFLGLSHSFEKMYQAIRRCWRFGQYKKVNVYIITSDAEQCVVENIQRKEKEVGEMMNQLIKNMSLHGQINAKREEMPYKPDNNLQLPLFLRD
jgi:hypothetical protein